MAAQGKPTISILRVKDGTGSQMTLTGFENWRKKKDNDRRHQASGNSQFQKSGRHRNKCPPAKTKSYDNNTRTMGFKRLQDLLYEEPRFITTSLANPISGFNILASNHPLRPDLLLLIIQVLSRMIQSGLYILKIKVLSETMTPKMMNEIKEYAKSICVKVGPELLEPAESFFISTMQVFDACITNLSSLVITEQFTQALDALSLSICKAEVDQSVRNYVLKMLNGIDEQVSYFRISSMRIDPESKLVTFRQSDAPTSYRSMAIVPTIEDFTGPKAYLRENVVQGSYKNCEDYLDVQFRLLREDLIDPLRTGLIEYLINIDSPDLKENMSDLRVYSSVKFIASSNDDGFQIKFDVGKKMQENINWESNKMFSSGSLLLLTQNNFNDFFVATVTNRNVKQLNKGIVTISFVPGTERPRHIFGPGVFFMMAESDVFYEAYRPVLSALQEMTEPTFPMKKYIVDVNTKSTPPKYWNQATKYIVGGESGCRFNVLDKMTWPSSKEFGLNASQHQALICALTNEFAVIQGPPGTGKTHLALKITEMLLRSRASDDTPIVVVCYTNHALDQFLEGLLRYTKSLIRIGGQSKNEALEQYNLDVVRQEEREKGPGRFIGLPKKTYEEKKSLKRDLEKVKKEIAEIDSAFGILDTNVLKYLIPRHHHNELTEQITSWLYCEDHRGWLYKVTQAANYREEKLDFNTNLGANDLKKVENIIASHAPLQVKYSFSVPDEEDKLRKKLLECRNFQSNNFQQREVSYEKSLKEQIQLTQRKIHHFKHEAAKFQLFRFNDEKLNELKAEKSVWNIDPSRRWEYYFSWIHLHCYQLNEKMNKMMNRYQQIEKQSNELRQLSDAELIRKADIVGLTTSGAARRRVLLDRLNTKIVIVEEAAEVLEAHVVAALASSVQHVILIGDHKQLRPNPAVYELAKKFNLEISLFERMINNGLDCSTLTLQHRMRPEIASLICPAIYADLQNHTSTCNREKISGIDKSVFFLNHNHPEEQVPDSTSRRNRFEANFLIELCRYLLRNGYKSQEVTILATYVGQVTYMREAKERLAEQNPDLRDVHITSVDNFQGEESKIILLSLVRSNKGRNIGFLSTENRVCVALSRARDGLYIVGNMDNLTASSDIWPQVHRQLQKLNAIGNALALRCDRHPEQVTLASSARHISALVDRGCTLKCGLVMSCGHVCPQMCHVIDKEHQSHQRCQACERRSMLFEVPENKLIQCPQELLPAPNPQKRPQESTSVQYRPQVPALSPQKCPQESTSVRDWWEVPAPNPQQCRQETTSVRDWWEVPASNPKHSKVPLVNSIWKTKSSYIDLSKGSKTKSTCNIL